MLMPQKPPKSYTPLLLYTPPIVNIAAISTIAFYFNIYQENNKVFTISLYKIDQIINKREEKLAKETDKELVKRLLPTIYAGYKDAFLKATLDELPPYWTYNYKIKLKANNSLGYSPLYQQLIEKLKAIKQYLLNNLNIR